MADTLGLVAGEGTLPALVARQARQDGWRVVAFVLDGVPGLAEATDRVVPCRLGELGPVLEALAEEGIRHVVLAGRVWKDRLFRGLPVDAPGRALLDRSPDWTDEGLLRTAAAALETLGIELLDQRRFLAQWLAPPGPIAGPPLAEAPRADVALGLELARELARRGIGQTVVLRAGTVTAVEALEGTDAAIRRGLALAGTGGVVVKAVAPAHDYRFDVPTVGPATLAACVDGKAAALAVEAGRVLIADAEAVRAGAERAGLSVVGVAERAGSH